MLNANTTGHWKRNCPKYLVDKKDGKVNKGILDIHVIDVYLLVFIATPQTIIINFASFGFNIMIMCITTIEIQQTIFVGVYDHRWFVAKVVNSKRELQNKQRLVKGEVTMCVGSSSKIDMIIIAHSLYFRD